ncbi:MAG: gliding motility-associated ABC transporter substrate-binding protein GldG [Chitinophagales bacterium]|nr:gliding motility-associated ABC transporter substrate-binding protein GldG [Chitinophagales bacterium]
MNNHPAKKLRTSRQQALTRLLIFIGIIVLVNVLSSAFILRIDLTSDKRFTLTDSSKKLLRDLDDVVFVKVYLKGDFPSGFKRLSKGTRDMLDEFKVYGGDEIQYEFEDPTEGKTEKELNDVLKELSEKGLEPTNVQNQTGDEYSEKIIVPGAILHYKGQSVPINLLDNTPGTNPQTALNNSLSHLENKFSVAIQQLSMIRKPKIGFIRGQGEMNNLQIADFMMSLSGFYELIPVELNNEIHIKKEIKAVVIAKPTKSFSEENKFKLDQYIMNGGKALWLVEALNAELDSVVLRRSFLTVDYPLNLEDQLFRYGIRINPDLMLDLQCNPVPLLVSFEGQKPSFKLFPSYYFPIFTAKGEQPIVKNIDAVSSQFASTIDTLALKGVKKTILLASSANSRIVFTPWLIDFKELKNRPRPGDYNKHDLIAAVLLEGEFPSVFTNRVPAEMQKTLNDSLHMPFRQKSAETKMIVISDGDIAKNEINTQGQPMALGYYRFTGEYFGNKNFLLNCIDYLTGYEEHIETRSKTMKLRMLDASKVKEEKLQWQLINLIVPLAVLSVFGLIFNFIRYRKYAK